MPVRIKLLLVVLFAAMVASVIYVYDNAVTGSDQASQSTPESIDRLIPASSDEVLAQATVGVDLAEGYDAYLVINGVIINNNASEDDPDGLVRAPTLGTIEYDPAPGRRIEKLESPRQCVDAFIWRVEDGPTTATQFNWCFKVS